MKGLITKSTGSWYQVLDLETRQVFEARIRGKFKLIKTRLTNPLAVGDFVEFQLEQDDIAWITKIEPRKNYLIRKSVNLSKEAHIIASNLDLACIIFTLQSPETSLGFLDRFLACCEAYNIPVLILFNKIDLLNFEEVELVEELQAMYENLGYQTLQVSSAEKLNLDKLQEILKDKTCVFFGHSGAGKSTLVKALNAHYDCIVTDGKVTYKNKNLLEMDVSQRANEGIFMSFQSPVEVLGVNNSYFLKTAYNEKRAYLGLNQIDAMEFLKLIKEETGKFNIDRKLLQRDLNDGFSGGEKKRNELIQLLMLKPDLIMLDEIDSGHLS